MSPELLISEERYDKRGSSVEQPASSCAGASVMHDCGDLLEQPFVGTIVKVEDVLAPRSPAYLTPATGDDGTNTADLESFQQDIGEPSRIVDDDTTEADVDWTRSGSKEVFKFRRRRIRRRFPKEEATHIFIESATIIVVAFKL